MFRLSRGLVIASLLIVFLLQPVGTAFGAAGAQVGQPPSGNTHSASVPNAPAAATWYDGLIKYSTITNCVSIIQGLPYQENGVGTYAGFLADPDAGQPSPNTTYYVHVVIAGLGNSCSGMRAYLDVALPTNTAPAIDSTNQVYCLYDGGLIPSNECPQSLPPSSYNPGAYVVPSIDAPHAYTWPIPQGHILEIQIPVRSTTALTDSTLQANVWMLDGNSSPWLRPQQGVYVFSNQPTILYPSPSTTLITASTAHSEAYLYTYGATGTGYFDLGTDTTYGLAHDAVTISTPGTAWLVWDDWGPPPLQPDTLYHWRFTFTSSTSQTYYGPDQTFRTLPAGHATVGQGIAADCTETAFLTALGTAQEVAFDCGALPITITLSSAQSIASNVIIDGGNKVTLAPSGASNLFNVQPGAHLTLSQVTLSNGTNYASCGGAVHVLGNAQLTLSGTRFLNNTAVGNGGALCIDTNGRADVSDTLFLDNRTYAHGGAIGNYGTLAITNSFFSGNAADYNGGGIDSTVLLTVTNGTFTGNTAGYRGGGINNYLGQVTIAASSFISNTAGMYGGGVSNDAGTTTIQTSSFFNNRTPSNGGGLENSGTLNLTNSTVSANHADTGNGGGLFWVGGSITLLNSTVAGNTAGSQGGNIYAGGASNASIRLKNTLVSSGSPNNCDNPIGSDGHNLDSANSCGLAAAGDLVGTNPNLGTLQDNGGPTWTHALLTGSQAVDAGTDTGCPATDQRGVARPAGIRCDIGAFELVEGGPAPVAPAITSALAASGRVGTTFNYIITASGTQPITFNTTVLPPGLVFGNATISGVPTTSGATNVSLTATNAAGSDTKTLVLTISPAITTPQHHRSYLPMVIR